MTEDEYVPQPNWIYVQSHKGWVGVPTTAAQDFTEADLEELI
jgi:hypothetical protein